MSEEQMFYLNVPMNILEMLPEEDLMVLLSDTGDYSCICDVEENILFVSMYNDWWVAPPSMSKTLDTIAPPWRGPIQIHLTKDKIKTYKETMVSELLADVQVPMMVFIYPPTTMITDTTEFSVKIYLIGIKEINGVPSKVQGMMDEYVFSHKGLQTQKLQ